MGGDGRGWEGMGHDMLTRAPTGNLTLTKEGAYSSGAISLILSLLMPRTSSEERWKSTIRNNCPPSSIIATIGKSLFVVPLPHISPCVDGPFANSRPTTASSLNASKSHTHGGGTALSIVSHAPTDSPGRLSPQTRRRQRRHGFPYHRFRSSSPSARLGSSRREW